MICLRRHSVRIVAGLALGALMLSSLPPSPVPMVGSAHAQVATATALTGLMQLLSQINEAFSKALISGDEAAKNRIRQASVEAEGLIARLREAIADTSDRAEMLRIGVASDAANFLRSTAEFTQQFAQDSFLALNETLLNASIVLGQLPFVEEPAPFVLAVTPLRMPGDAQNRQVQIHGYFPDATASTPVFVTVAGQRIAAAQGINRSVVFDLPQEAIKPSSFVPLAVEVPVRRGFLNRLRGTTFPVSARIYIENPQPFSFRVQFFGTNTNRTATLRAPTPLKFSADSSQTSNRQSLTAADLFSRSINNNIDYDMNTATFAAMDYTLDQGAKPCNCCDASTAVLESWTTTLVRFALSAPTCSSKWCTATYWCGGGGTHAEIYLTPTFQVQRRGVAAEVEVASADAPARRRDAVSIPMPNGWTSVRIVGRYADGDDRRVENAGLTASIFKDRANLWDVEAKNGLLVISTR